MIKRKLTSVELVFALASFLVPIILYYLTSSDSLMFDDAAEFALVIKLGSIAHPPGNPAYILTAMIWQKIAGLFGFYSVSSLTLYSSFCIALCSTLLFFAFRKILSETEGDKFKPVRDGMISLFSALTFATGTTTWAWANTVEVYSFQALAIGVAFSSLVYYHFNRSWLSLILAGFGIALGISNHHLTMVLFLPCVPFFFLDNLFVPRLSPKPAQKKKPEINSASVFIKIKNILFSKQFWQLAGVSFFFSFLFYGWMFLRAQKEYPFMFGQPDTLAGLFYHLECGPFLKFVSKTSSNVILARVPFFVKLTFFQFFLLIPFLILGLFSLVRSRMGPLFWTLTLFFLLIFFYQLNNNQWASTDAYLLMPFVVLVGGVFFGIRKYFTAWKLQFVLPVLLAGQIFYNYPQNDKHTYSVSRDLMHLLDTSAPKNSIVLIEDWSTVIQYYYYRIAENFRPDLIVLNGDVKFTHYRILPVLYPDFYKKIKPEYDSFIEELRKEHPEQVTICGCDLTTPALMESFKKIVVRMEAVADTEHIALLTDPRTHMFYSDHKFYSTSRFISGCFVSSKEGDSVSSSEFLKMDVPFLNSKLLLDDGAALEKMEDYHAMLDYHVLFYKAKGDSTRLDLAEKALDKILRLQRIMRKNMSFAYVTK